MGAAGAAEPGFVSVTRRPSSRNAAARIGKSRTFPRRSSNTTEPRSQRSTAPQNPLAASSTTVPRSAGTSGTARVRRLACRSGP